MSQSELNNKLRDKLGGYESEIDDNALWSSISDRVPQKKKRRGAFWIWGGAGMIIFLSALYGFGGLGLSSSSAPETKNIQALSQKVIYANSDLDPAKLSTKSQAEISIERSTSASVTESKELSQLNQTSLIQKSKPQSTNTRYTRIAVTNDNNISPNHNPPAGIIESQTIATKSIGQSKNVLNTVLQNKIHRINMPQLDYMPIAMRSIKTTQRKIPRKASQFMRPRNVEMINSPSHMWQMNYYAGAYSIEQNLSSDNKALVNDGSPYFSQGTDLKYSYQFPPNLYLTASVNYDVKYKLFEAEVQRDTIVPSSQGEQVISTNEYINGGIDNLSGIPDVPAKIKRSIKNLNSTKSLNIGLGVGYMVKFNRIRAHIEGQVMRSIYTDRSGLAIVNKEQKITPISSLDDLYSAQPQYNFQLESGLDIPLYNDVHLVARAQYRKGITNQISGERGTEYLSGVNGVLGIRVLIR